MSDLDSNNQPQGGREAAMVVIQRDAEGKPTVWCDPEIVDLVTALNAGGISTVASCSGHGPQSGIISLRDGRELIIAGNYDTARRYERAIAAQPAAAQEAVSPEPYGWHLVSNNQGYRGQESFTRHPVRAELIKAGMSGSVDVTPLFDHPPHAAPVTAAPAGLDAHGLRALDNCIRDLRRLLELADDFALDEMQIQSLLNAIESMELRKCGALPASTPAAPGIDLPATGMLPELPPLLRHAASLLRLRGPAAPSVEKVAADLDAAADGVMTSAGPASQAWLGVSDLATDHFRGAAKMVDSPKGGMVNVSPNNCRNRLMAEGKPYPKSGCAHCKTGGLLGCPYEKAVHGHKAGDAEVQP